MINFVGAVAAIGAVGAVAAKFVLVGAPWLRKRRDEAERYRTMQSAEDVLTMEFGHETVVEKPEIETVMRAIDRMGMPERPSLLALASPREDYVQAEFLGDGAYRIEARRHDGRRGVQLQASRADGLPLDIANVKAVFAAYLSERALDPDLEWRDISGRY